MRLVGASFTCCFLQPVLDLQFVNVGRLHRPPFTALFAEKVGRLNADAEDALANSKTKMMEELQAEWGDKTTANLMRAKQAADLIAERAGFDQAAVQTLVGQLAKSSGDAMVMRLFATVGDMMSEDSLTRGDGGGLGLSTTPAEARAELAKMEAPGGEFFEAVQAKDQDTIQRLREKIDRLTKIATG